MPWTFVTRDWPAFVEQLCAWFPYFDEDAVRRFRGDRSKLVTYLAETHDLTEAEASDQLGLWFFTRGRSVWREAQAA